jgi:hypothetical protein
MGGKELKGAYKGLTCMHIRAEVSNFEKKKKKNNSSYKHRTFESNFEWSPLIILIQLRTFG